MKFIKSFLALSLLLGMIFTTSCQRENSEDVNQDRIYTRYEVVYKAEEDKTYARASFRFGSATGTKLELTAPSEVSFNGDILTFNGVLAYYEKEYAGFVDAGTFSFTDTDGKEFVNTIEVNEINLAGTIDTITKDASYEVFFQNSLVEGEEVIVTINGENEGDAQIFSTNDIGSTSIICAKNKIEKLGTGPGTLYMEKLYTQTIQEAPSAGGTIVSKYKTENESVYIK